MNSNSSENIAHSLEQLAQERAESDAIIVPRSGSISKITFQQLDQDSNRLADGLRHAGMAKGDRILLMVPAGIEFISLTFALFKLGAVPVLIDPGLGRRNVLNCIATAQPKGMIAIPLAHAARKAFPKPFKGIELNVTVGRRWFWGGATLNQIRNRGNANFQSAQVAPNDDAAILFTSGSTGPSKGVLYSHSMHNNKRCILHHPLVYVQFYFSPDLAHTLHNRQLDSLCHLIRMGTSINLVLPL